MGQSLQTVSKKILDGVRHGQRMLLEIQSVTTAFLHNLFGSTTTAVFTARKYKGQMIYIATVPECTFGAVQESYCAELIRFLSEQSLAPNASFVSTVYSSCDLPVDIRSVYHSEDLKGQLDQNLFHFGSQRYKASRQAKENLIATYAHTFQQQTKAGRPIEYLYADHDQERLSQSEKIAFKIQFFFEYLKMVLSLMHTFMQANVKNIFQSSLSSQFVYYYLKALQALNFIVPHTQLYGYWLGFIQSIPGGRQIRLYFISRVSNLASFVTDAKEYWGQITDIWGLKISQMLYHGPFRMPYYIWFKESLGGMAFRSPTLAAFIAIFLNVLTTATVSVGLLLVCTLLPASVLKALSYVATAMTTVHVGYKVYKNILSSAFFRKKNPILKAWESAKNAQRELGVQDKAINPEITLEEVGSGFTEDLQKDMLEAKLDTILGLAAKLPESQAQKNRQDYFAKGLAHTWQENIAHYIDECIWGLLAFCHDDLRGTAEKNYFKSEAALNSSNIFPRLLSKSPLMSQWYTWDLEGQRLIETYRSLFSDHRGGALAARKENIFILGNRVAVRTVLLVASSIVTMPILMVQALGIRAHKVFQTSRWHADCQQRKLDAHKDWVASCQKDAILKSDPHIRSQESVVTKVPIIFTTVRQTSIVLRRLDALSAYRP